MDDENAAERSPLDAKSELGDELKRLRVAARTSREDTARMLKCSLDKVGKFERGASAVSHAELMDLLDLYGMTDPEQREALASLGVVARRRGPRTLYGSVVPVKLRQFFRVEETARRIRSHLPELIPGLCQTEGYARAVLASNTALTPAEVDVLVKARLERGEERLFGSRPVHLSLVMPESAFRIMVGGPDVMREQLHRLIELAELPNMEIRQLRATKGAVHGRNVQFSILTPSRGRRTVVYLENLTDGIWVDDQPRVDRYLAAYEQLIGAADSVEETVKALARVAADL
ncbi:helix-turn-helix transcriptional regulator [Saccharothrix xinjiangensis]|uniref:Helix-turn-helix domain-containing protein n=1 Tax=Saccharothrix xinjiangensis TaxID=204798 RepID=A0ABV9XTY3_9PSEU